MMPAFERRSKRNWAGLLAAAGLLACATAGSAQDETRVKAGLTAWKTTGCPAVHGPVADGDKEQDEAPSGANLRSTRLDNLALTEVIRCGKPNTGMPHFDEGAYTQRGCYGQPPGPVPDALYPTPRIMSADEIEAVVTYLRARVIGRRAVTPEECAYYYEELAD